jgi:hypothetical protein
MKTTWTKRRPRKAKPLSKYLKELDEFERKSRKAKIVIGKVRPD